MTVNFRSAIVLGALVLALGAVWTVAWAYPGGPLDDVTDAAPYCAGCHSSTDANQLRGMAGPRVQKMTADAHIAAIKAGEGNYAKLSPEQRTQLATDVAKVDSNAKVSLDIPAQVARGSDFSATIDVAGGSGPVVGVMLLDDDIRNQSRPIEAEGFQIVGAPAVTGPDGQHQEQWEARRYDGLARNLNFIVVFGVTSDLTADKFSTAKVTYNLTAPSKPGSYTICAAFLYGTEKASPIGRVDMKGHTLPLGGFEGGSGRIKFTELKTIAVK